MTRRKLKKVGIMLMAAAWICLTLRGNCSDQLSKEKVKVGILHSESGTMAMAEKPIIQATKMAVDEINENGGVLGYQLEYILEDGASDTAVFGEKAKKLIIEDKVKTIFGCWTSASKKAVLPVVEKNDGLLWYPVQYEGLESSHNIMYTGSCPNQQAIPALEWLIKYYSGDDGILQLFLFGSDYVYPRTAHTIIKAMQGAYPIEIVGEEYIPLGYTDCFEVLEKIRETKPDVVINTINGDSNVSFFQQFKEAGLTPEEYPTMSFSCYEEDIRGMGAEYAKGHFFAWSYFQSVDTESSRKFTEKFKALYGRDCVTGDPVASAYESVYLWKKAVELAGTFDVEEVIRACESGKVECETPKGLVTIAKGTTHHCLQKMRIGVCDADGQIERLWESKNRVEPDPWLKSYDWAVGLGTDGE